MYQILLKYVSLFSFVQKIRESNISALKKALAVLQYITISQLGCGTDRMKDKPRSHRGRDDIGTDY